MTISRLFLFAVLLYCLPSAAVEFPAGPLYGQLNLSLSYGMLYRTSDQNKDFVAQANGGKGVSVNSDDGSLNYDTGIASNVVGASAELILRRGWFTAYMRGTTFYDFEQENGRREHRPFESSDLNHIGSDTDV